MTSAELLTAFEQCDRRGYFSRDWETRRILPTDMLYQCIASGLTEPERPDFGERAGEMAMELAEDRGLLTDRHEIYPQVTHLAALADVITTAIRKPHEPFWKPVEAESLDSLTWTSGAYEGPENTLRRVVLATSWSDERHYREVRSWRVLGEVAIYRRPMKLAVIILGQNREGRRHGPFSKGFIHPKSGQLRFRKKGRSGSETFKDSWKQVWREEVGGTISTYDWMKAMAEDDILQDVAFSVEVPVPDEATIAKIRRMAAVKLQRLAEMKEKPEMNFSGCAQCPFLKCCWSEKEFDPSESKVFVKWPS